MKRSLTEMVFMLLLMTLFVGCSFVTIEKCAGFYQAMLREQQADDQIQLPYLVLFNRLQGLSQDQVELLSYGGQDCLAIREQIGGRSYQTLFYYQDGALMELLTEADREWDLSAGEALAKSQPLRFSVEEAELEICWQAPGGSPVTLSLQLKEGAK